jgi:hypothetical protein
VNVKGEDETEGISIKFGCVRIASSGVPWWSRYETQGVRKELEISSLNGEVDA